MHTEPCAMHMHISVSVCANTDGKHFLFNSLPSFGMSVYAFSPFNFCGLSSARHATSHMGDAFRRKRQEFCNFQSNRDEKLNRT